MEDIGEYQKYKALLWTAPEFLRLEDKRSFTTEADVFSFSIILQEVLFRVMPYFIEDETPKGNQEIIVSN